MHPGDCPLCRAALQTPILRECRFWRSAVNRNQDLLGKTIIVLKRHEESVAGLRTEEWTELLGEIRYVTDCVRGAFDPDHFNYSFLMNMDRHVHLHVIPRYVGPRTLAGVEFSDPEYPAAYQLAPSAAEVAPPAVIAAVYRALVERAGEPRNGPDDHQR